MAEPNHQSEDPDVSLMLRCRDGDEAAFETLVSRWQAPLINFFYRSLQSHEQAEDLAQLVFIRVYRAAKKYEPQARFSTYLFHIARRILINEFRRAQRKPVELTDPADLHAETSDDEQRAVTEIEEAFSHALEKLPENQRTAILLLKQQELSYAEIAEIMQATESAVKTWIHRARQFLKQALKEFV